MTIRRIILFAFILRLLIIPLFFHPDIKDIHLRVSFLGNQGVVNIYDFLENNELTKINAPDFVYPPLTYFFLGSYQVLIKPILGVDFNSWLIDFSGLSSTSIYIYRYLILLKIPYLIFEFLVAYILFKMLNSEQFKKALFFWLFNPLNLYAIYAIGQFDIIPASLTFLSFYLWNNKHFAYSGLVLGVGAAFKTFPLLIIPFFWLSEGKIQSKLIQSAFALGAYGFSILPFITSPAFQKNVLFSGLSQRIFELQIPIMGIGFSLFFILYLGLIIYKLIKKSTPQWALILSMFLMIFSISRFHPQWIVWLTPFLTLAVVFAKIPWWSLAIFFIFYFATFAFFGDKFLLTALLAPVSPIFLEVPPLTQLISPDKVKMVSNFVQLLFAGSSLLIVIKALKVR